MSFSELGLSEELLKAIADAGYDNPTPIQQRAIPSVLMGRDVLGTAQTGTGKTAGFTLPMIDILSQGRSKARMPRSLILEPTRELAAQVAESFEIYGKYHKLTKALLIGGSSFGDQDKLLDRGVDVLIATPGRLLDHTERGKIILRDVKIFVIDESDRMLDMGFIPDIERIAKLLPPQRQTLLFSATMPKEIKRLADTFMDNPKEIEVARPATTATTITDAVFMVSPRDKNKVLRELIRSEKVKSALVFCNRKRDVDTLKRSMDQHGFSVGSMHGDMTQERRIATLAEFKNGEITILVASDVAARGLDIPDVSHVFNYDVPIHADDYVHRIGRTGRAGRSGKAFTLATREDGKFLAAIERVIGRKINIVTSSTGQPAASTDENNAGDADSASAETKKARPLRSRRKSRSKSGSKPDNTPVNDTPPGTTPSSNRANVTPQTDPPQTETVAEVSETPVADQSHPPKDQNDAPRGRNNRNRNQRDRKPDNNGRGRVESDRSPSRRGAHKSERNPPADMTNDPVQGLGDHIPAFLQAPVKKAEAPVKKAEAPVKKAEAPVKKAEAPAKAPAKKRATTARKRAPAKPKETPAKEASDD